MALLTLIQQINHMNPCSDNGSINDGNGMIAYLKHQHQIELYYMPRNTYKQIPTIKLIKVMKFEKGQQNDAKKANKEALSVYSKQTKLKKFVFQLCEIIAKNKKKRSNKLLWTFSNVICEFQCY